MDHVSNNMLYLLLNFSFEIFNLFLHFAFYEK